MDHGLINLLLTIKHIDQIHKTHIDRHNLDRFRLTKDYLYSKFKEILGERINGRT